MNKMETSEAVRLVAEAYEQFILSILVKDSLDSEEINSIIQNHLEQSISQIESKLKYKLGEKYVK